MDELKNSNKKADCTKNDISKKELETVFDSINEMVCIINRDFIILRANQKYADFFGKKMKDLIGARCFRIFGDCANICTDCPSQETFLSGMAVVRKQIVRKIQDDIRYFEIRTIPVLNEENMIIHSVEFIKDVTEEKRMIEQLIRSEKLASIGIMTAGIAHEMNNPLSGISGNAVNLLAMPEKYGLNDKGVSRVNVILESAARATLIMKDLLHLSKKENATKVPVDINKLLLKAVNAVHLTGIEDVKKEYSLDDSLPFVMCDPSKIDQVIINIVTNAVQSLCEKRQSCSRDGDQFSGKLQISTARQPFSIRIAIADNGMGIDPEIHTKIFDPFFSTKPTGQGTGLGLSICHRIVEEHKGKLFFESVDDLTIFVVELPIENKQIFS